VSQHQKPTAKHTAETRGTRENGSAKAKAAAALIASNVMHTITHHTSFVPSVASLQVRNETASASSHNAASITSTSMISNNNASNSNSNAFNINANGTTNSTASNNNTNTLHSSTADLNRKRPYALYHPRNLGLVPPTVTKPPEGNGKVTVPHSAGCRMKFLPQPTFRTLPIHPDFHQNTNTNTDDDDNDNDNYISTTGLTCPTVMNNSNPHSGQVAIGDTGGSVTLYVTLPSFLPIRKLCTSAYKRFVDSQPKRKRKKQKRIGRSTAIVGSSIDRNNAVESILLLKKSLCVMVGTRMEIECISFENEIKWTWGGCMGWDSLEKKVMVRGIPLRLHGDCEDQFVLASFGFFSFKDSGKSSKQKEEGENDSNDVDVDSDGDGDVEEIVDEQESVSLESERPQLYSPILKINVATGEFTNVVPMEQCKVNGNDNGASEWKECNVGTRAMAIYDKLHRGNIVGVFITYTSTQPTAPIGGGATGAVAGNGNDDSSSTAITAIQELMVLDSEYHIVHRTAVPTKSSGTKLITVEAINQSPNGDFTISATAKGGVLVYRTDGLQLLGAYGEGVSLHGHSIVWQDVFFIRIDKEDDLDNDNSGGEQRQQWGQIMERPDELMHRERYKEKRKELSKKHDSLSNLFIVSVPSAFREPADMKEHIQFWDVSRLEFDRGNKLPSFELLAPKKSEGICTLLYDHSMMTANAGKFIMSTHAGDCVEMTPTLVTDWAGQMYPTGFIVLDNNLAYIEDEDELDQVIDSHLDQTGFCQGIGIDSISNMNQSEAELELALQMSMMDEHIDVVGNDDEEWSESLLNVAPCRPEPHLRVKSQIAAKDSQGSDGVEGSPTPYSMFDLMKQLPQFDAVEQGLRQNSEDSERRMTRIEETKQKMLDGPVKIPRRKQGNIDFLINASVDKQLTVRMLEKMGPANGDGSNLRAHSVPVCDQVTPATLATGTVNCDESTLQAQSTTIREEGDPVPNSEKIETNNCLACQGRFVIHSDACGKRARPIDYDAIAKAEQEKKDIAEEEKRKLLQDRRKIAEQKRKEKKLKLKEEEEKLQQEKEEEERKITEPVEAAVDLTSNPSYPNESGMNGFDASSTHQQPTLVMQNSMQNQYDYHPTNHHQSSQLPQSPSYFQQPQNSSSPHTSHQSSQIYQHDGNAKSSKQQSPSFGSMNFGDSIFSNIPSLPSEPSSYYGSGGNRT
jgi:hypothetical protein